MSTSIPEVQSVLTKVTDEKLKLRAKDTGGADGKAVPCCNFCNLNAFIPERCPRFRDCGS